MRHRPFQPALEGMCGPAGSDRSLRGCHWLDPGAKVRVNPTCAEA